MRVPAGIDTWLSGVRARLAPNTARADLVAAAVYRTIEDALYECGDGTVFVSTGDIPAMWLRDSAAIVRPLLAAANDPEVADLLIGVNRRQLRYITIDPWANAFNQEPNGAGYHRDFADQSPWVWERKYEVDSAAWVFDLAARIYRATGRTDHLDATWSDAVRAMLTVWRNEQNHMYSTYYFTRPGVPPHDTLSHDGRGAPVAEIGLTWSGFRPSDDSCVFGYLVPANCFAAVALEATRDLAAKVPGNEALAHECDDLAREIRAAITTHAVVRLPEYTWVYAYEVDGYGHSVLQDDANVPSLLSLPYLGWCRPDEPLYRATREFVLSDQNPFYVSGEFGAGLGSSHTPRNHVWPLALAMQGLTTSDTAERLAMINHIESALTAMKRVPESYHVNDVTTSTREWFAWADMTYVDLILATLGVSASVDW